ncbi:hypothetical protein [Moorena sp. SIOASIH]|uniref:hypothetical protein n=1 Tax=Moorena sp. SIOASIH TaxID=2607817 RepID=UPI0025EFFB02|nr:hypothetical protein [Moorena sp. SIOASIH]
MGVPPIREGIKTVITINFSTEIINYYYFSLFPILYSQICCSLFPVLYSQFPIPDSRFPIPNSKF